MSDDPEANRPPGTPAQAPPRYDDEVSLRELYLILRRGAPSILVVTAVTAVAAIAWVLLSSNRYESEATVVSAPTTVQVQGAGTLAFEPRSAIAFATYEDIATSRATFERTIARLQEAGVEAPDGPRDLLAAATVERLTGPANAEDATPLTVVHRIAWSDPSLAARYADVWANTTVEQVRATLLADLEPARAQTVDALAAREAALAEAEAAYRDFQANDLPGIEQELRTVNARIATTEDVLVELDRRIASLSAQREVLIAQVDASEGAAEGRAALDLLEGSERLEPDTAAQLRLLADPGSDDASAADVVGLLARADLQAASVELGGALQERGQLRDALERAEARAETLRERVAELRLEEAALSRRLNAARDAFDAVQAIEPALAFVANLTPGNTRVLNTAQEPTEASGPGAALVGAIAALAAAVLATLFVFLREAVRDPADAARGRAPTAARGA